MPNFLHLPLMSGLTKTFHYNQGLFHQREPESGIRVSAGLMMFAKIREIADTTKRNHAVETKKKSATVNLGATDE